MNSLISSIVYSDRMSDVQSSSLSRTLLRQAISIVALLFVLFLLWTQRNELAIWLKTLHAGWAFIAFVVLSLSNVIAARIFSVLLASHQETIPPTTSYTSVFLVGQLGKYLPGRIWGIAQQISLLDKTAGATSVIVANLEVFILIFAATSAVGFSMLATTIWGLVAGLITLLISMSLLSLLPAHLGAVLKLVQKTATWLPQRLQKLFRAQQICHSVNMSQWTLPWLLTGFCVSFALGWFFLFYGAVDLPWLQAVSITAALALSTILGMLSMLPGGLGVREAGIIGLGLSIGLDGGLLASSAVAARASTILIDLMLAGMAVACTAFYKRKTNAG